MEAASQTAPSQSAESVTAPAQSQESAKEAAANAKEAVEKKYLSEDQYDALMKLKIDGQEHELSIKDLAKLTSLEKASQSRMEKAAKLQQQVQQFIGWAKENPDQFLKETGIDPDDFAEARLAKKYEMMQMSPEQKELLELRQLKEAYEKEQQQKKKYQEDQQKTAEEAKMMQGIQEEFVTAWKESGLPVDRYFMSQAAYEMLSAAKQKRDLSAKDAAAKVKEKFFSQVPEILMQMDPVATRQVLAKVLKKLQEDDVKRATDKQAASMGLKKSGPEKKSASPRRQEKAKKLNEHEWREYVRKMADSHS